MTDDDVQWRAFAVLLAVAACLHVLGNGSLAEPAGVVAVAVGAALVLALPGSRLAFGALAAAIAVMATQEAPLLGNHWLLAAFVALAASVAMVVPPGGTRHALAATRLSFLLFYGFAAFAKLNHDFLDPTVSCAGQYADAALDSIGLRSLNTDESLVARRVAALATVAVELAVPVLLLRRRTRSFGVALAIGFHGLVALPRAHQFYDFSSVLLAGWVTFLPASVLRPIARVVGRVRFGARTVGVAAATATGFGGVAAARGTVMRADLSIWGWWAWQLVAIGSLVIAVASLRRARTGADVPLRPRIGPAWIMPALVFLNGLTPYFELKTQGGWNMYSNLRTAGGESNHLLVRRTYPLTSPQDDLVTVVATNEPQLAVYREAGFVLPVRTLRAYLEAHPHIEATFVVGEVEVRVAPGRPLPVRLGPPVPDWVERWFLLRAVDASDKERCQTSFLPAR